MEAITAKGVMTAHRAQVVGRGTRLHLFSRVPREQLSHSHLGRGGEGMRGEGRGGEGVSIYRRMKRSFCPGLLDMFLRSFAGKLEYRTHPCLTLDSTRSAVTVACTACPASLSFHSAVSLIVASSFIASRHCLSSPSTLQPRRVALPGSLHGDFPPACGGRRGPGGAHHKRALFLRRMRRRDGRHH